MFCLKRNILLFFQGYDIFFYIWDAMNFVYEKLSLASCIISVSLESLTCVFLFWSLDFYVAGFPKIVMLLYFRVRCKKKKKKMKRPHTSLEDWHAWRGRFWWGPCALIRYVVLVGLEAFLGMYLMSGGCGLSSSIQGAETGMMWALPVQHAHFYYF